MKATNIQHKCPYCGRELKAIAYTEHGRKVWNGKKWQEDSLYGDCQFNCPDCGGTFEYDELAEMGVF